MSGLSQQTIRSNRTPTVVDIRQPKSKPSMLATLKSVFLFPCTGRNAVQVIKHDKRPKGIAKASDQQITTTTRKDIMIKTQVNQLQIAPVSETCFRGEICNQSGNIDHFTSVSGEYCNPEDDGISIISLGEARWQSGNINGFTSVSSRCSDHEDDGISIISLGETRQVAQLRIDGRGIISDSTFSAVTPGAFLSSITSPKTTLPPIESLYKKKIVLPLKKILKQTEMDSKKCSTGLSKKQVKKQKKAAKKSAKREKVKACQKKHKKMEKLASWLKEAKKKVSSAMRLSTTKGGHVPKYHIKLHKYVNRLQRINKAVEELSVKVMKLEKKIEDLTSQKLCKPVSANTPVNTQQEHLENSDSSVAMCSSHKDSPADTEHREQLRTITVCPKPTVFRPSNPCTHDRIPTPQQSTAVRRVSFTPDVHSSNNRRSPSMKRIIKDENYARGQKFQRPLGAHHARVRSTNDNIQEFLPYDHEIDRCDSDSDDEIIRLVRRHRLSQPGAEGMIKFEETHKAKTRAQGRSRKVLAGKN